jgi:hypothetical protein
MADDPKAVKEQSANGDDDTAFNIESYRAEANMIVPPPEDVYQISGDRLTILCKKGKDVSLEYSLCFIGEGLGLI